jgi:hypothetical protein
MALETTPTHPLADSYVTVTEADAYLANRKDVANYTALTNDQKEALLKLATKHIDSMRFRGEKIFEDPQYFRLAQNLKFPGCHQEQKAGNVASVNGKKITSNILSNVSTMPDDFWNDGALVIIDGTGKGKTYKVADFVSATGEVTIEQDFSPAPDTTSRFILVEKVPLKVKYAVFEQALYICNGGGERQKLQSEGVKSYSIGDLSETFGGNGASATSGVLLSPEAKNLLSGLISRIGRIV